MSGRRWRSGKSPALVDPLARSLMGDGGFRALGEDLVYEGPVVRVYRGRFAGPDGGEFDREVVRHPGAVGVVPVLDDGAVLLVRQYRSALDALVLEIPAGKLDVEGEAHEGTAARELEEEVGYHPGRLEELGRFHNSPGFADELVVVYLATDLERREASPHGVEEEHMTVERVPLASCEELIRSGEITDAKTVIGLLLARDRLREGGLVRREAEQDDSTVNP